jgi:hypothetical protein
MEFLLQSSQKSGIHSRHDDSVCKHLHLQVNILFFILGKQILFKVKRWISAPVTKDFHNKLKVKCRQTF